MCWVSVIYQRRDDELKHLQACLDLSKSSYESPTNHNSYVSTTTKNTVASLLLCGS